MQNITDFFLSDYLDFSSYDNYRKIASYCDGLKPSARKILFTVIDKNINKSVKVDLLSAKTGERTLYLHGIDSLGGVAVKMAQTYPGTNNIPLLTRDGAFGNRVKPEASAARYIKTAKENIVNYIFRSEDIPVLIEQEFEGDMIEPRFFMPIIPMLLVNGSNGLSTGFRQYILPRNPEDIVNYILSKLAGDGKDVPLMPWYRGFNGDISIVDGSYVVSGKIEQVNTTTLKITEVPVYYDHASYIKELDKLEDTGVIKSYSDKSISNKFEFVIKVPRNSTKDLTNSELLDRFKLSRKVSEIFTCNSDELSMIEYNNIYEIIDQYIDTRLYFYEKRKQYQLDKMLADLSSTVSRYMFIKGVLDGSIKINKVPEADIEAQLDKNEYIKREDGTYKYLLRIPIGTLTKEKFDQLATQINKIKSDYNTLQSTRIKTIWKCELNEFLKVYKKEQKEW
jgi:DNA topoisomerase-2